MKVKFVKLKKGAKEPQLGSGGAAGADLIYCTESYMMSEQAQVGGWTTIPPHTTVMLPTGIAVEIPQGYFGAIYARSGLATKQGLAPANKVGIIDSDYRGEIFVPIHNHTDSEKVVNEGDRIAQLVIQPYLPVEFEETDKLEQTERGEGGFGSTGV